MIPEKAFSLSRLRSLALLKRLWPLLLPLLLIIPGSAGFPYPSATAPYSDLAISHYPNAVFLKRALLEWGHLPLWSPTILSGYPFAANPLSSLWYLPGWLALIFPLPLGFNLLVMLHLLWGGLGMYALLRQEGLAHRPALLGALGFEMLPKLFAHYGAGHLTLVYALSWTPWLWLSGRAGRSLDAGLVLGALFLADPRWAPYAGLVWLADRLIRRPAGQTWRKTACSVLTTLILAFLIAAPLALPLLEYTRLSTRTNLVAAEAFIYSLPPLRLLGLLAPAFSGFHEWLFYPGGAALSLVMLAVLAPAVRRKGRFWIWVGGLTLFFALGAYLPGLPALGHWLGMGLLRVPTRALFLTGMAIVALAAHALHALLDDPASLPARRLRLGLVALNIGVILPVGLMGWLSSRAALDPAPDLMQVWVGLAVLPASILIVLLLRQPPARLPLTQQPLLVLFFAVCLLDWGIADAAGLHFRPRAIVLAEQAELAAYLSDQPGIWRSYSPSYSLPQQVAAQAGLELADGVDPLQLQAYVEWMETASGVPQSGYSVTLPAFAKGEPAGDNQGFQPDPERLSQLNVRYLCAEYPLNLPNWVLREVFGTTRVYENQQVLPRAWVQPPGTGLGQAWKPVGALDWEPNRIAMTANGPGLLVLSELAYPGWEVTVDGQRVAASRVEIFRAVELEHGSHQVVFSFRPVSVYAGLVLAGVGLLGWMILRIKRG